MPFIKFLLNILKLNFPTYDWFCIFVQMGHMVAKELYSQNLYSTIVHHFKRVTAELFLTYHNEQSNNNL